MSWRPSRTAGGVEQPGGRRAAHGVASRCWAWSSCFYVGAVLLHPLLTPDGVSLLWWPNVALVTGLLWLRPQG